MSKPTLATLKSFIRKNAGNLVINVTSSFDGMTDCCESQKGGFRPAVATQSHTEHTLGIEGAWIVGQSRDTISHYEENGIKGFTVYNCCGSFVVGIRLEAQAVAA